MKIDALWGSLFTVVCGGTVYVMNAIYKIFLNRRTVQFTEQGIIIDRQEKQVARLETQIQEQQNAITTIQELHAKCREDTAKQRVCLVVLVNAMRKAGIAADLLPEILDFGDCEHEHEQAVFIAKTTQQNTVLLSEVDAKLKEPPPAK